MSQETGLFLPLHLASIRLLLEHCVLFWSLHLALRATAGLSAGVTNILAPSNAHESATIPSPINESWKHPNARRQLCSVFPRYKLDTTFSGHT